MKYYQLLFYIYMFTQLVWAHGIHKHGEEEGEDHDHDHDHEVEGAAHEEHEHEHEHENEKVYPITYSLIGIAIILLCAFLGTILPIIFRKKSFFREDTLLFSSIKLFGTGVILAVAFIHMVIPAGQILSSEFTYEIFSSYSSFAGVFAILGIILTHIIQVYTSHFLYKNNDDHHAHDKSSESGSSVSISVDSNKNEGENKEEKEWHKKNAKTERVAAVDGCVEEQHGLLHLMENKEKQIICYLLEIGISLHSILIGIAFGMTNDEELLVLMVALVFHQFFEGVSLSSVFIEAHFKRSTAIIIMVIVYSLTLPIGAIIGLLIRSAIESTDKVYLTTQGIIDAVAGGILIYDDLVNILSRHCNSKLFKNGSIMRKNVQLIAFYCGIAVMAVIGIWA